MKTACGVIRDLLPLYAEKMTGEESDALIREHLAECRDCSEYLEKLQNPLNDDRRTEPSETENSLKLIRSGIRSRKRASVLFTALLVFVVMLTAFSHVVKPAYVSYENSGITVSESGNGDVYAHFADGVTSCRVIRSENGENQPTAEIEAWTSLWDKMLGKTTPSVLISSKSDPVELAYYCDLSAEGGNVTVVYGTDTAENRSVLPRLILGYYFAAALIAAAVLGLACILFRKDEKKSRICGYLLAAPLSYLLAHLLVTTTFVSFSATSDFILNCAAALAVYGVMITGNCLLRQHKKDVL
jgi:hypothetical protein